MIARTQYDPTPTDLDVTLALVRGRTLAVAGERLGLDASTVFCSLQRLERGLGRPCSSARARATYPPNSPRGWPSMPSRWKRPSSRRARRWRCPLPRWRGRCASRRPTPCCTASSPRHSRLCSRRTPCWTMNCTPATNGPASHGVMRTSPCAPPDGGRPVAAGLDAGDAVALDAVLQVADALVERLCPHLGVQVLVATVAGVAPVVVPEAGHARGLVVAVQHESLVAVEGRRLPGGDRVAALAAVEHGRHQQDVPEVRRLRSWP